MRWGTKLESVVAEAYAEHTGRCVVDGPTLADGFRVGHLDRITVASAQDGLRVVECKTARSGDGWGEEGTDEIPEHYAAQGYHYLSLVPYAVACDFPVLIAGSDFRVYTLQRDDRLIAALVEQERAWWERHVEGMVPPDPLTTSDYQRRWRAIAGKVARLDDVGVATAVELARIKARIKFLKDAEEEVGNRLRAVIGDAEAAEGPDGGLVATWREQERSSFDLHRFREDHPQLAAAYEKASRTRTLLLKVKSGEERP